MLDFDQLVLPLIVALGVGLLVGLERGWEFRARPEGSRVAGFRTFGLLGLLGAVAAILAEEFGDAVLAAAILAYGVIAAVAHWRHVEVTKEYGITTLVAGLLVMMLGALAGLGYLTVAAVLGVLLTFLLSSKAELHAFLTRVDRTELFATLRMLLISVVVLPVLPDQGYGPWDALNPFRIWLMVVLIAGISYVGYVAVRLMGDRRGILATALFGGMVSSTAVAINLSRLAKGRKRGQELLCGGIVGASAIMFPRMLIVAAVVSPTLALRLAPALIIATLIALAAAARIVWHRKVAGVDGEAAESILPNNPLDLKMAVQFGLLLAVVMFLGQALNAWVGDAGLYALAAASGIADVDAIVLSLATMANSGDATFAIAAGAIALAAFVNSLVKPVYVAVIAGPRMGLMAGIPLALAAGVALIMALAGIGLG